MLESGVLRHVRGSSRVLVPTKRAASMLIWQYSEGSNRRSSYLDYGIEQVAIEIAGLGWSCRAVFSHAGGLVSVKQRLKAMEAEIQAGQFILGTSCLKTGSGEGGNSS
ncbi:hypothetical protein DL770_004554 [Monosporascus sp. CRB-9-2]|nr:hypothetical protein DL770_004554 [Monosporascus sp. CRB-9-2]